MSNTETEIVPVPAADTPEGGLWREILAHVNTTTVTSLTGHVRSFMNPSALVSPELTTKVDLSDIDNGMERDTNTRIGGNAFYSLIRATPRGRALCAIYLKEQIEQHRHLAIEEAEVSLWVLHNLSTFTVALWAVCDSDDPAHADIALVAKIIAALKAEMHTT